MATMKKGKAKKRSDGQAKLPANARRYPLAHGTYVRILEALQQQAAAVQLHNQKAAESQGTAQTVADERGLGPIQLHSVVGKDGKYAMWYVPKKGRAAAPDHVHRGTKRR